jgi:N-methylhydantoinase A
VHHALDEAAVREAALAMQAAGIKALAICFLHAYANPAHEQRASELVRAVAPDMLVCTSSEVSPVYREYERTSTTSLNAYVMPAASAYVRRLSKGLSDRGYDKELFIMQSNGGVATTDVVVRFPIRIIESGPAAGALTAARYAKAAGTTNIISFDMGGTTAKLCLIENGRPKLSQQFEVDTIKLKKNSGLPINIPAIDLIEIGAGGGSIARVELGAIAVGPESASSEPGPICYGRGGTRPTVTDADLVLGYINPDYFLGGEMKLDLQAAKDGIARDIATPLGISVVDAAWGIYEIVTSQMGQAAKMVSVGHGKDPRTFAFIPFGGAGCVHGARLARLLGCTRIVFPRAAGVATAIGLLMADAAFDLARTTVVTANNEHLTDIKRIFADLRRQAIEQLDACGVAGARHFSCSADMRFLGQGYEITVEIPDAIIDGDNVEPIRQAFFDTYAATYGDRSFDRGDTTEMVHFRMNASVSLAPARFEPIAAGTGDPSGALRATRPVYFPETGGFAPCKVYDRYALRAGDSIEGPAIVEERESTVVVLPNSRANVDADGNIVVDLH